MLLFGIEAPIWIMVEAMEAILLLFEKGFGGNSGNDLGAIHKWRHHFPGEEGIKNQGKLDGG